MKVFVRLLVFVIAIGWAAPSDATLLIEPVSISCRGLDHPPTRFHFMIQGSSIPRMANIPSWQTNLARSTLFRLGFLLIRCCYVQRLEQHGLQPHQPEAIHHRQRIPSHWYRRTLG